MSDSLADLMKAGALRPMASHDWTGWVPPLPMASHAQPSRWDKRADGSQKGNGYLGLLARPDGSVSSEISVSTDAFGGKEFPLIVPTLTPNELTHLLNMNVGKDSIPPAIIAKAQAFAAQRVAQGKPLFAQPGEENVELHPHVKRVR